MSDALNKLAELCVANGDSEGALAASTKLVALEPLNEAAHRRVMELHAKRNAYAEALRQYRVCRDVLRRELDVAPEPATEQLYRDLMRRRRAALGTSDGEDSVLDDTATHETARVSEPAAPVEMRPQLLDATILVARLEGLLELEAQLDPEESHMLATQFHRRVHEAVTEFGGRADRRVGSNVLAVFGIPTAYGNEPERASSSCSGTAERDSQHAMARGRRARTAYRDRTRPGAVRRRDFSSHRASDTHRTYARGSCCGRRNSDLRRTARVAR